MFTAEYVVNKLGGAHKLKKFVQATFSGLVVVDTVRSFYIVSQLAKERFKVRHIP